MIKILSDLPPFSIGKVMTYFVVDSIGVNLVYLPMFVVTYRIYRIFQSRSIISKSLSDKRLLIVIIVIMIVTLLYNSDVNKVFTLLTSEFYFSTYDDIIDSRYPIWLFQIMKSMI